MKNKLILGVLLLLLAGASFFIWNNYFKKDSTVIYKEYAVKVGDIIDSISTAGLVEPQNRLEILPPISGRIDQIFVKEGDVVKKGQALAIMSSTERAALLDAAQTEGKKSVEYWEKVYKPTTILAPISGKVIVRSLEPGQTINSNTPVLVLADKLIIKAQVDETDIGKVLTGQKVKILLDAYRENSIDGIVGHISYESKIVNNVTIYQVDIIPDHTPSVFRSGMSASLEIIREEKQNVLLLPERLINYQDNHSFVLVKELGKELPLTQKVKTGLSYNGKIEIESGLNEKSVVVEQITKAQQASGTKGFLQGSRPRPGLR
ncbi:MAG: HlyD family efflux transporter periplasmic adaptor subunit [Candidatus Margulisbacteria bacterium]|nr:HlyD family efflux transporter periplasmic adaptor subunit [Candidatus Margulisiibacteriota bacterium]